MTTAFQQQAFALDARYNAHRVPGSPNFRTLYIRRRSQLLRENTNRDSVNWKQYLKLRGMLLQQRYGAQSIETQSLDLSKSSSPMVPEPGRPVTKPEELVPTEKAEASRALVGGNSIAENYAFVGVHHIYDQHSQSVTMVKFANNDRAKLCCCSLDGTLSVCNVTSVPPTVTGVLKGHTKPVTGFDWSIGNDLIVSTSLDGTCRVWKTSNYTCLRIIQDENNAQLLCCLFQPINNNLFVIGTSRGELKIANVSTGRFMKNTSRIGGNLLSLAADASGKIFWVGNDRGEIISLFCELNGALCKTKKLLVAPNCAITSLSYRAWISREARDPLLLVNATNNTLCLFSVLDSEGTLQLKRSFQNRQQKHIVRSTFCPIMSFRRGACVVTGSEDGSVYFVDVEKTGTRAVVNTLQGHSNSILGISFNYDESLLATSDLEGLVIIWKRGRLS